MDIKVKGGVETVIKIKNSNFFMMMLILISLAAVFTLSMSDVSAAPNITNSSSDNLATISSVQSIETNTNQYNANSSSSNNTSSSIINNDSQNLPDPQIYNGGVPVARGIYPAGYVFGTIQAAIDAALPEDTIMLESLTFTERITVSKALTFSVFNNGFATIDGSSGGRVVNITTTSGTVTFNNITFTNGLIAGNGGAINNPNTGTTLVFNNCTFTNNSASLTSGSTAVYGGAIYSTGPLTATNCTFTGNTAISGSTNVAYGGAIYSTGTTTISGSTFTNNSANSSSGTRTDLGGAIYSTSTLTVTNSDFTGNSAYNGGAIYKNAGNSTITSSNFVTNTATNQGGAFFNNGGTAEIHFNRIINNSPTNNQIRRPFGAGTVNAQNNWWGSNSSPTGKISGTVNITTYLVLTVTPATATIPTNGNQIVTADLTHDQNGTNYTTNYVPNGTIVTFALSPSTIGSLSSTSGTTTNGSASTTFTGNDNSGTATITATIDTVAQNSVLTIMRMDVYVSQTGSDTTGNGSISNPYLTILTGYNNVYTGGNIHIIGSTTPYVGSNNRLTISKNVNIIGESGTVTINGQSNRIFTINSGAVVNMSNLTLTGGSSATGGAISNAGTLNVTSCIFTSNNATNNGGAIYNTGTLSVNNSTFTSNTVNGGTQWTGGGAIYNNAPSGNLNVVNSSFSSNSAPTGGAIICMTTSTVTGSTFTNNTASRDNGAAISFGINNNTPGAGTMNISNNYFTGNTATTNGGAIWSGTNGSCIISNNNFVGNIANANGGAIRTWGTTTITSNNFINNTAVTAGGAISIYQGTTTASFNRIINNGSNDVNLVNTTATLAGNNNWWGINSGPSTGRVTGSGTLTLTTWLQLRITANPTGIPVNGTSTVTATLLYDNNGNYHDPSSGHVPDAISGIFTGIPVSFSGTLGTVNPGSTVFNLGTATTTFTGVLPGTGSVSATVDSQTESTPIYIGSVNLYVQQYPWYYDTLLGYVDTYNYNTVPVFIIDIGNYGVNDASGVELQYVIGTGFNYITCNTNGVGTATYNSLTRTITWNIGNMPVDGYAWMMVATRAVQTGDKTTALTNTANLTHVDQYDVPNAYKTASYALNVPTSADIQVEQTYQQYSSGNGVITINVTNNGPDTATGVEITDLLPSGLTWVSDTGAGTYDHTTGIWNIDTLTNGQTKTLQITVNVSGSAPIPNRAVKTNEIEYDWNFNNDSQKLWINSGHTSSVEMFVQQYPWYYDTAMGYVDTYYYNTVPIFIVDIGNYGTDDATGVEVQYIIGAGYDYVTCNTNGVGTATYNSTTRTITWNIGNMPVDGYAWMMIATRAIQTGDKTAALTNTANLTHVDQYDVPNAYKTANYALNIPTSADIQVGQTTSGTGNTRTITITVTNNGPDTATGVEITDLLPSGLTWVSDTGAGTYDHTTGIWNIDTMTNGQTKTLQITVNITGTGAMTNRAVKTNVTEYDWNFNNDSQQRFIYG